MVCHTDSGCPNTGNAFAFFCKWRPYGLLQGKLGAGYVLESSLQGAHAAIRASMGEGQTTSLLEVQGTCSWLGHGQEAAYRCLLGVR